MTGHLLRRFAVLVATFAVCSGCLKQQDFRSPADRLTTGTAYTEQPGVVRIDVGVGGTTGSDLFVAAGLTVGLPARFELNANFAHYGAGILNLRVGWNAVDTKWFALGLQVGFGVMRPQWMWYLDELYPYLGSLDSDMTMLSVPVAVIATFPVADALHLTAAIQYDHVDIFGTITSDVIWFDGALGSRRLLGTAVVQVFLAKRIAIQGAVDVPFAMWYAADEEETEPIEPGVEVGSETSKWRSRPPWKGWAARGWIEMKVGKTHVEAGVGSGAVVRAAGIPLFPFLGLYWRL